MNMTGPAPKGMFLLATLLGGVASAATAPEALVLGDSVPFGFIDPPGYEAVNADNFLGFGSYLERRLGVVAVNASCPGETTGSYSSTLAADDGCRDYKKAFPLHVSYNGTQDRFAQRYLATHPAVQLVTITLGANDAYVLQRNCQNDVACVQAGLPDVATRIAYNLGTVVGGIRAAGYRGDIIVTTYYSPDYTDPVITGFAKAVNTAISTAAQASGATVADLFTAFQAAAKPASGRTCAAGLLNVSNPVSATPPFGCDIHPSQSGQKLIAETIAASLRR